MSIKTKLFTKKYLQSNLLDDNQNILNRIKFINSFNCNDYMALVDTKIDIEKTAVHYSQEKLKRTNKKSYKKDDFLQLVYALEYFNDIGFIHGDINQKNIIYTQDGFKIVDYEPSLLQIKNNIKQFMITKPYISIDDLNNNSISTKTDKLGFFYFILRKTSKLFPEHIVLLAKTLNHKDLIGVSEDYITNKNYSEILDYAMKFEI